LSVPRKSYVPAATKSAEDGQEQESSENSATLKMGKNNAVYHGTNSQGSSYTNYDSGETVPADG